MNSPAEVSGPTKVNPAIIDAVNKANLSVMGQARAESQAVTFESLAHSLSLIMHNAGMSQFNSQQLGTAAVARTCEGILSRLSG